jgi:LacI family transcriptional regulator
MQENKAMTGRVFDVDSHRGESAFEATVGRIQKDLLSVKGIFVSNAWTHSVARAAGANARLSDVAILGYDLVPKNLHYLKEGRIRFLISQCPSTQGYEGLYSLYEHVVMRETVKRTIMVPIDILTKDNVKYYQG